MPYFIRAKTYYRYAEEQLKAAEEALAQKDYATAWARAKEAVERALRALWGIVEFEAPKEKPPIEKILAELDRATEPWLAKEIKKIWKRLLEIGASPGPDEAQEAVELARFVVSRTRDVLEPIIGPPEPPKKRPFIL